MNLIKHEALEKSMYELQFSLDAETFNAAIEAVYKREGKKYNVPGFRKGKAPRRVIEKMSGPDVFYYDAINDLFPEAYEAAVKEAGIEPVGRPEVDIVSATTEDGVVLKVNVAVRPEVILGQYEGLKATKEVHTVEEADVDAEIRRMQERNARTVTREGNAENGDIADLDFEGFVDGVAFEGGKAEHYSLELGSGSFIPGFEEQVVGHAAGEEFDLTVTFPEDYQAEELAGKEAVFKIKLHEVNVKELPALDDEFAKDVSEFDTLDELKANIRKEMEERNDKQADLLMEDALVKQVVDNMQCDVPDAMCERRMDELVNDFEYRLNQQGLKLEVYLQYAGQTMEEFRETYKEQARTQVKIRLALEAVAEKENIQATDEEYEAEMQRVADLYKLDIEKVKMVVEEDQVRKDLAVNKAVDLIREKAEITTNMISKEDAKAE